MSHTSPPPAEIEATVQTENIGRIEVNVSAPAKEIWDNEDVDEAAREYLLQEFDEVHSIYEVL